MSNKTGFMLYFRINIESTAIMEQLILTKKKSWIYKMEWLSQHPINLVKLSVMWWYTLAEHTCVCCTWFASFLIRSYASLMLIPLICHILSSTQWGLNRTFSFYFLFFAERLSYPLISYFLRQWCRRRGCRECKRTPKSFDLVKIREKSLKIWANVWKNFEKSFDVLLFWKSGAQNKNANRFFGVNFFSFLQASDGKFGQVWGNLGKMAPDVLWFEKYAPKMKGNVVVFGGHFWEFFSGKLREIWAKILRNPKICLLLHLCSEKTFSKQT